MLQGVPLLDSAIHAHNGYTMNAQLVADHQSTLSGLRPLDPRRDLSQVADLIEEAFSGELEPGGLAALRDLRMLARMGPLVGLIARSDPYMEDVLGGFVWIEDNRVVGNVTIQRLDPYGSRWQIANVAVSPPYRSRGIGRALMEASLERIAQRSGQWAVLQVRASNDLARRMYEQLGFEQVTEEITMQLTGSVDHVPAGAEPDGLRPYDQDDWQARYQLQAATQTGLDQWWRPVRSHQYRQTVESRLGERLWEFVGRNRVRRWVVPAEHGLAAYLGIDARRWEGRHTMEFAIHPRYRGHMETQLVSYALDFLSTYPRWPVRVEHRGRHPELVDALMQASFAVVRHHLTMRLRLMP